MIDFGCDRFEIISNDTRAKQNAPLYKTHTVSFSFVITAFCCIIPGGSRVDHGGVGWYGLAEGDFP